MAHVDDGSVRSVGAEDSSVAKHPTYTRSGMQLLSEYTVELTAHEGLSAIISVRLIPEAAPTVTMKKQIPRKGYSKRMMPRRKEYGASEVNPGTRGRPGRDIYSPVRETLLEEETNANRPLRGLFSSIRHLKLNRWWSSAGLGYTQTVLRNYSERRMIRISTKTTHHIKFSPSTAWPIFHSAHISWTRSSRSDTMRRTIMVSIVTPSGRIFEAILTNPLA